MNATDDEARAYLTRLLIAGGVDPDATGRVIDALAVDCKVLVQREVGVLHPQFGGALALHAFAADNDTDPDAAEYERVVIQQRWTPRRTNGTALL